jgi:hypothetical protein
MRDIYDQAPGEEKLKAHLAKRLDMGQVLRAIFSAE